jgi:hypothetical protein
MDHGVFFIELNPTGPEIRAIGVLVDAGHQVPVRFGSVDAVVFVVDATWVPEANLQSCGRRVVGVTRERCRIDSRVTPSRIRTPRRAPTMPDLC